MIRTGYFSKKAHRLILHLGVIALLILNSACSAYNSDLPYNVQLYNYGQHGVIVHGFPAVSIVDGVVNRTWRIEPSAPGPSYVDGERAKYFIGHKDALPENLTVRWKLAEVTNCDDSCVWTPIEGGVFSESFNIKAIATRATPSNKYSPADPNCLIIKLIFREDKLKIKAVTAHYGGMSPIPCYGSVMIDR